jgi:hypothetical protein
MHASLRALLSGLTDYAGLFPPAKLPFPEALANYLRYREGEDAWMLGRFICPAARLAELPDGVTLTCSALGRGGDTVEAVLAGLEADLADLAACRQRHAGRVVVDVLEVKLPPAALADEPAMKAVLGPIERWLGSAGLTLFLEPPIDNTQNLAAFAFAIIFHDRGGLIGLKLRAGGMESAAFPSCEQVAEVLALVIQQALPFKATAGLHHPFPRFDESVKARQHGFINLFVAGVLGQVCGLRKETLRGILEDEDTTHFVFDDAGLRWCSLHATTEEITAVRQASMISFGSCSFDEPRDDLCALGWL